MPLLEKDGISFVSTAMRRSNFDKLLCEDFTVLSECWMPSFRKDIHQQRRFRAEADLLCHWQEHVPAGNCLRHAVWSTCDAIAKPAPFQGLRRNASIISVLVDCVISVLPFVVFYNFYHHLNLYVVGQQLFKISISDLCDGRLT